MTSDRARPVRRRPGATDHPALSQALVTLARSLDRHAEDDDHAPSYLELAVLVANVQGQLDDLTRILVHLARRHDNVTWKEIAETFGISRPTVYKRFGEPSPNDAEVEDTDGGRGDA